MNPVQKYQKCSVLDLSALLVTLLVGEYKAVVPFSAHLIEKELMGHQTWKTDLQEGDLVEVVMGVFALLENKIHVDNLVKEMVVKRLCVCL